MPRTIDKRIEAIDIDEGRKIVMLRAGFAIEQPNTPQASHVFGADTDAEIRRAMKEVEPCACDDCSEAIATGKGLWS